MKCLTCRYGGCLNNSYDTHVSRVDNTIGIAWIINNDMRRKNKTRSL